MSPKSWATNGYVTDQFRISLRRGPSTENKILKFLPSGYPVEILENQQGWSLVRSADDVPESIKGWVLSRYLITRQPWEKQARSLFQENAALKKRLAGFENKWKEALKKETDKYEKLKGVYDASQKTLQRLIKENERLKFSQRDRLFILGAVVLFIGLIGGVIVGRPKKRRYTL
jgi:SH3 domain protein